MSVVTRHRRRCGEVEENVQESGDSESECRDGAYAGGGRRCRQSAAGEGNRQSRR